MISTFFTRRDLSDPYGVIVWRKLGMLDFRQTKGSKLFTGWNDKYHPQEYFGTWMSVHTLLDPTRPGEDVGFDVWTVLKADNLDWVPPVAYATQFPTIKKLPIAISDAKLQKWLKASQPFLVNQ